MIVGDVMTREVISASPRIRLKELAELLTTNRISGVPVVDGDRVVGVISEGDILLKESARPIGARRPLEWIFGDTDPEAHRRRLAVTVGQAMSSPAVTIDAERPLREAAALMVDRGVNRLPVTDGGRLAGIVTRADLVRAYLRRDEEVLRTIREDVIRHTMWLDPDDLRVEVNEGIVRVAGSVDRRSTAVILDRIIGLVDGVGGVSNYLTWELDDRRVEPAPPEPEPGAASLAHRERPPTLHG